MQTNVSPHEAISRHASGSSSALGSAGRDGYSSCHWEATQRTTSDAGFEGIRAALGSEELERTLRAEIGDGQAEALLVDLRPYLYVDQAAPRSRTPVQT